MACSIHCSEAFNRHHALQCGYCTSGMLMNAAEFLRNNPIQQKRRFATH